MLGLLDVMTLARAWLLLRLDMLSLGRVLAVLGLANVSGGFVRWNMMLLHPSFRITIVFSKPGREI